MPPSSQRPTSCRREIPSRTRRRSWLFCGPPWNSPGASLQILGFGVTGYAKDVLKAFSGPMWPLWRQSAHTSSALHYYDEVDVICDVGGQDIKIMILKDGQVKDFKLNTQCSAGNGYFLQSTAQSLGVPVEQYAEVAFKAETMPIFRIRDARSSCRCSSARAATPCRSPSRSWPHWPSARVSGWPTWAPAPATSP